MKRIYLFAFWPLAFILGGAGYVANKDADVTHPTDAESFFYNAIHR